MVPTSGHKTLAKHGARLRSSVLSAQRPRANQEDLGFRQNQYHLLIAFVASTACLLILGLPLGWLLIRRRVCRVSGHRELETLISEINVCTTGKMKPWQWPRPSPLATSVMYFLTRVPDDEGNPKPEARVSGNLEESYCPRYNVCLGPSGVPAAGHQVSPHIEAACCHQFIEPAFSTTTRSVMLPGAMYRCHGSEQGYRRPTRDDRVACLGVCSTASQLGAELTTCPECGLCCTHQLPQVAANACECAMQSANGKGLCMYGARKFEKIYCHRMPEYPCCGKSYTPPTESAVASVVINNGAFTDQNWPDWSNTIQADNRKYTSRGEKLNPSSQQQVEAWQKIDAESSGMHVLSFRSGELDSRSHQIGHRPAHHLGQYSPSPPSDEPKQRRVTSVWTHRLTSVQNQLNELSRMPASLMPVGTASSCGRLLGFHTCSRETIGCSSDASEYRAAGISFDDSRASPAPPLTVSPPTLGRSTSGGKTRVTCLQEHLGPEVTEKTAVEVESGGADLFCDDAISCFRLPPPLFPSSAGFLATFYHQPITQPQSPAKPAYLATNRPNRPLHRDPDDEEKAPGLRTDYVGTATKMPIFFNLPGGARLPSRSFCLEDEAEATKRFLRVGVGLIPSRRRNWPTHKLQITETDTF
ncbi:unnamed protein product [Protopolystoma xenopodis]|uniref:Uncharacterized protein n=1 Tax=Protopolystoma xenopodis TaxID=117903 RepID=A0A448WE41_9PLAT|nr:unnamed protein product [Protopolystoma xenopodis]